MKMAYVYRNLSCELKTVVLFLQIITNCLLSHPFGNMKYTLTSHFGINPKCKGEGSLLEDGCLRVFRREFGKGMT